MRKYELQFDDESIKDTIHSNTLNRNDKLFNLIRLLNSMNENHIISIDGSWGSGKTFFIKQLMYLKSNHNDCAFIKQDIHDTITEFDKKYILVYYNAWENDDHNDPLESIIYNLLNILPKYSDTFIDGTELFDLIKKSWMNFIEVSSLGIVKTDDIKEMKTFSDLSDSVNTIEEKKNAVLTLLSHITRHKRILLIIDELDRCKTDFAVKLIETIKHFYDSPKMSTIFVTNNNQLSKTIKKFYGNEFDGYSYLNKIYDAVIPLHSDNIEQYSKKYLDIYHSTNLPEDVSIFLFKHYNFSYRECNKYMSMYRLIEPYIQWHGKFPQHNSNIDISCIFVPISIALKVKDIYLYEKFIQNDGSDILKELFDDDKLKSENSNLYRWFCEIFKVKEGMELSNRVANRYKEIFISDNTYDYGKYPYMEAISMLGNLIHIEDDK